MVRPDRSGILRVVLAAGGTGGHVYPALAVAAELKRLRPEVRLLFIGGDRMEAQVVPAAGIRFHGISVHGLAGRGLSGLARRARSAAELALGIPVIQSRRILREFMPQVVIGTGGYASGPVLYAAKLMHIPSIALEGNRAPGLTSKLLAKRVNVMAVAWPEQEEFFSKRVKAPTRVVVTGLPIRPGLADMTREEGARALGFDPALRTLVIIGGSLGSEKINEAVAGALRIMDGGGRLREVQILHATGRQKSAALSPDEIRLIAPRYKPVPYLDAEYSAALAAADLVVTRAGASTVAEIGARGLPAILIPWAQATTGEQSLNAEPFGKVGAAVVIRDADLTPAALAKALDDLLWDDLKRARMARASKLLGKPRAAEAVAQIALELAEGRRH